MTVVGHTHQDPELLRRLLRAKDRMDAASDEEWPVRRLARVSGVSEAHFARSFKEAFGVPPHRYLLTRRLERAKALLRDTDLSITEIAFQTGWDSLGTFGRTFRDVTGESPGELRAREKAAPHDLERVWLRERTPVSCGTRRRSLLPLIIPVIIWMVPGSVNLPRSCSELWS